MFRFITNMINSPKSLLQIPKQVKIPECIVRKYRVATIIGPANLYKMADAKTGVYAGEMVAYPAKIASFSAFYPPLSCRKSFKIEELYIEDRGQGYGTKFINLAKAESRNSGCGGRVHLVASRIYSPNNPPHLFYRKLGFTSKNKGIIKYFDKCIKSGIQIDIDRADNVLMYLPLKYNKFVKFFRILFRMGL